MAKKVSSTANKPAQGKLTGKTVAFVGKFGYQDMWLDKYKAYVASEGGRVVDTEKTIPDYLVAGKGRRGNPPGAVARIKKQHPTIQILDAAGFCQLLLPAPDEFHVELRSGPKDHSRWDQLETLFREAGTTLDLCGVDLREANLYGAKLLSVKLDGANLRKSSAHYAEFGVLSGIAFDDADLTHAYFQNMETVSFRNANLSGAWLAGYGSTDKHQQCDFTGAQLTQIRGRNCQFLKCTFCAADLSDAEIENSSFSGSNLAGANLSRVHGSKAQFAGANLSGAVLFRADLRDASLKGADLRNADLREAVLNGADLSGAEIEGADFAGAVLTGAKIDGLDPSRAKNVPHLTTRTPGPKILEMAKIASASKKFVTSAEVDLGKGEHATLTISNRAHGNRSSVNAGSTCRRDNHDAYDRIAAPSFEQGLLNLADRWPKATLRLDSIQASGGRTLRGKKLQVLAMAAWAEAFGLDSAAPEKLQQQKEDQQATVRQLRETMLAELQGGAAGVEKWNARSKHEREQIGALHDLDLNGAELAGVRLDWRDLQASRFRGANLKKANLWSSQLGSTDFAQADLTGARLPHSKCDRASFEGAKLVGCDIHIATLTNANFRGADLTDAKLDYSSLVGSDFTDANLTGVHLNKAKYDQTTKFPKGFVPPETMQWIGPPRGMPTTPAAPGTLDFATFFQLLGHKIEASRLGKALAMLKAERFQLFAEVKDASLVGVVKSQSNAELVYSCRLAADGTFSCCTQNLKPCGGLRGQLCKHLLVLVVGLTKAAQLDPATVAAWVEASKSQKPQIDQDVMSNTFLRYKGAEAGEVDWRPTETVPEDYYAF